MFIEKAPLTGMILRHIKACGPLLLMREPPADDGWLDNSQVSPEPDIA